MVAVVKRIAWLLGMFVFLLLLLVGVFSLDEFTFSKLPLIILKAGIGFIIFWIFGIIVADTVIKGIASSIENSGTKRWEGGLTTYFLKDDGADADLFDDRSEEQD